MEETGKRPPPALSDRLAHLGSRPTGNSHRRHQFHGGIGQKALICPEDFIRAVFSFLHDNSRLVSQLDYGLTGDSVQNTAGGGRSQHQPLPDQKEITHSSLTNIPLLIE